MIKKIEVTGEEAFKYCRDQVMLSGKTMANLILNLPLEKGKVYSYVPENTLNKNLFRFSSGGIHPFDISLLKNSPALVPVQNDAKPIIINAIIEYLKSDKEDCCLFEDPVSSPLDPWVKKERVKYVHLNQEMYYFFNNDVDKELFEKIFTASEGYYFLCALGFLSQEHQLHFMLYREISAKEIEVFVSSIQSFFIRAYDGEGFLEWTA